MMCSRCGRIFTDSELIWDSDYDAYVCKECYDAIDIGIGYPEERKEE